jgi:hypothetical protein
MLPVIATNPTFNKTFRFLSLNGEQKGQDVITVNSILNLLVGAQNTLSTVAAARIIAAARVNRVRVYGVSGAAPTGLTDIVLEWVGYKTPNRVLSAVGDNAMPAIIDSKPPKNSAAYFWMNTSDLSSGTDAGEPLFALACAAGCFCDVSVSFQLFDADNANLAYPLTNAGAFPPPGGYCYIVYNYLDNTSTSLTAGTFNWVAKDMQQVGKYYG